MRKISRSGHSSLCHVMSIPFQHLRLSSSAGEASQIVFQGGPPAIWRACLSQQNLQASRGNGAAYRVTSFEDDPNGKCQEGYSKGNRRIPPPSRIIFKKVHIHAKQTLRNLSQLSRRWIDRPPLTAMKSKGRNINC